MTPHPASVLPADAVGLAILVVGLPAILALARRTWTMTIVVLVAYVLRGVLATVNHFVVPAYDFDADWVHLNDVATSIANLGPLAWPGSIELGREFYAWLIAPTFMLVGPTPFVPIAVNVVLGSSAVIAVHHLATAMGAGQRVAVAAAVVAAAYPTSLAYAVQPSREPLITLCLTLGILGLVRWMGERRMRDLATAAAGMTVAGMIHSAFTVALLIATAFVLVDHLVRSRRRLRALVAAALLACVGLAAGIGIVATGFGLGKLQFDLASATSLQQIQRVTTKKDIDNRTAYVAPSDIVIDGYGDVVRRLPERVFLFVAMPFPWQVRNVADAIGVIVSATTFVGIVATARMWWHGRTRTWWLLSILLSTQLVLFSWGTVNYGTSTRHRAKFVPVVLAIVAADVSRTLRSRSSSTSDRHRFAAEVGSPSDTSAVTEIGWPS